MPAGVLLTVAGVWVLAQILGGNALGRLGITGEPTKPGTTSSGPDILAPGPAPGNGGPGTGVPYPGLSWPSTGPKTVNV